MNERDDEWSVEEEEETAMAMLAAIPVSPATVAFFDAIEPFAVPFIRAVFGDPHVTKNDDGTFTYTWRAEP